MASGSWNPLKIPGKFRFRNSPRNFLRIFLRLLVGPKTSIDPLQQIFFGGGRWHVMARNWVNYGNYGQLRRPHQRDPYSPTMMYTKPCRVYMDVSKNRGIYPPKWMVKIMENPMNKWMIWGHHYFWKHPYHQNLVYITRLYFIYIYN